MSIAIVTGRSPTEDLEPSCVLIPAGAFQMGCDHGRDDERPVHTVCLDSFEMAMFQVRHKDFALFLQETGQPQPPYWTDSHFSAADQPVVAVSWWEANHYCEWLSSLTRRKYRLPTEAEWERAARGGLAASVYPWGDEPLPERSEYVQRWGRKVNGPLAVGRGAPNGFGLYDVCENVHEWCADWYGADCYLNSPERNPQGPASGSRRASRGGSWRHQIKASRCAARSSIPPAFQYADYGFRVARDTR